MSDLFKLPVVLADALHLARYMAEDRLSRVRGGLMRQCDVCGERDGHRLVSFPHTLQKEPCPLGVFEKSSGYVKEEKK